MTGRRVLAWAAAGLALILAGLAVVPSGFTEPKPTAMLLDRHGRFIAQLGAEDGTVGYWPVDPVPERVAQAVIAIEDRRFYAHGGVDPLAVARAVWRNLRGKEHSGASTIAMQVARMQDPGPRSIGRKAVEAATAMVMTLRHGREGVLRQYLRLIPFGNGSHGIAHAARWYLDKPVEDLSWAEIAFLAAIPQSPARMNPFAAAGHRRAVQRGHRILAALRRGGVIADGEFQLSERQIESLTIPRRERRSPETLHAVFRLREELARTGYRGGPLIQTSLDLDLQRQVQEATRRHLADWRDRGAQQAAVAVLDRSTREVLAWVGSEDYFSKTAAGAMDFADVTRSPGSALKPFLYALGLDHGAIAANTILADLPDSIWGIENADHDFLGPLLPRQALANSRNIPAAWLVRKEGLDEAYLFLAGLGLHDNRQSAAHYGLVLAVGALPTSLERLVRAYGALADDGRLLDLAWWKGQQRGEARQVMSPATARQVTLFLSDPAARLPSFPRLGANEDGLQIAVKTGTSQGYRDAWAVAWTDRYLVGVWTGRVRGSSMLGVSGGQSSATLAQSILLDMHRKRGDLTAERRFPPPKGYQPVELCAQTGLRSGGRCAQTIVEWFPAGQTPQEDNVFQHLQVDLRNGLLAAPWTPPAYIAERTFAALPPEEAGWGRANHLQPPPFDLSMLDRPSRKARAGEGSPVAAEPASLTIAAPRDGLRMARNPETPPEASVLNLRAVVGRGVGHFVWLVDGMPWRAATPQDHVYWPLSPGLHRFELATIDGAARSAPVTIQVE